MAANRAPLSKRAWQDVRRALRAQPRAEVAAVEVHGVKIYFRHASNTHSLSAPPLQVQVNPQAQTTEEGRASQRHTRASPADPGVASGGAPQAPRGNARKRRSALRLQEFMQRKRAEADDDAPAPAMELEH